MLPFDPDPGFSVELISPFIFIPLTYQKGQLPTKICLTCGRPFEYRKKWRNSWDEVKYCGEKCRRNRPPVPSET